MQLKDFVLFVFLLFERKLDYSVEIEDRQVWISKQTGLCAELDSSSSKWHEPF